MQEKEHTRVFEIARELSNLFRREIELMKDDGKSFSAWTLDEVTEYHNNRQRIEQLRQELRGLE